MKARRYQTCLGFFIRHARDRGVTSQFRPAILVRIQVEIGTHHWASVLPIVTFQTTERGYRHSHVDGYTREKGGKVGRSARGLLASEMLPPPPSFPAPTVDVLLAQVHLQLRTWPIICSQRCVSKLFRDIVERSHKGLYLLCSLLSR